MGPYPLSCMEREDISDLRVLSSIRILSHVELVGQEMGGVQQNESRSRCKQIYSIQILNSAYTVGDVYWGSMFWGIGG